MTTYVAVLTRAFRAPQAVGYLGEVGPGSVKVVITSDESAFDVSALPPSCNIIVVSPETHPLPSARVVTNRLFLKMVRSAREGSRVWLRLARFVRSAEWRLRYVDRLAALMQHRKATSDPEHDRLVQSALRDVGATGTIEEIAVFDVFDLATVLDFAVGQDIRVLIR